MRTIKLCVVAVLALALAACPTPPVPPTPDADASPPPAVDAPSPASSVGVACANLQAAGCDEGEPTCPGTLQSAIDERISKKITAAKVACVAAAGSSKLAIQACGSGWCGAP